MLWEYYDHIIYCFIKMIDWKTVNLTLNFFFAIQSGNYSFQLTNHLIWITQLTIFSTDLFSKEENIYKITPREYVHRCSFFYYSNFIFEENHVLVEENNSSKNIW